MKQIIENSLVVGTLLVLTVLPFIAINRRIKKKEEAGMIGRLKEAARTYGINLSRYEMINGILLCWDEDSRSLLFAWGEEKPEHIRIEEVSRCYTLKKMNGRDVRSVSLELLDSHGRAICSIPFYRQFTDSEMSLNKALKYSGEWELLITSSIKQQIKNTFKMPELESF
ncbi:hypothetical protein EWM62_10470 [Mucilaginibacter terrigena]|uniref:Uncharacterized protein n=1 Tax=Mucilaginibacter terrigena TaxID=2492395 RepID=A0A4Q5LK06_9SPHI|nr:hypothetical protein [Mucilaginibacter terrigena]RYU89961.1 hypothetical protein EWM62_10470 [Mucilaginibacter terrigena]